MLSCWQLLWESRRHQKQSQPWIQMGTHGAPASRTRYWNKDEKTKIIVTYSCISNHIHTHTHTEETGLSPILLLHLYLKRGSIKYSMIEKLVIYLREGGEESPYTVMEECPNFLDRRKLSRFILRKSEKISIREDPQHPSIQLYLMVMDELREIDFSIEMVSMENLMIIFFILFYFFWRRILLNTNKSEQIN